MEGGIVFQRSTKEKSEIEKVPRNIHQEQDKSSSNSHPSATANKAIHSLKIGGGGLQNQREHHIILTKYEAVHPTAVGGKSRKDTASSGKLVSTLEHKQVQNEVKVKLGVQVMKLMTSLSGWVTVTDWGSKRRLTVVSGRIGFPYSP